MNPRRVVGPPLCAILALWVAVAFGAAGPRFFPDDPIATDPESRDASLVTPPSALSGMGAQLTQRLEARGHRRTPRALNVNTIDEVPDSSWFTNRIRPDGSFLVDEAAPVDRDSPVDDRWTVFAADRDSVLSRIDASDARGHRYDLTFDARAYPEMTTGATIVAARLLHASGYNTPEYRLVHVRRERVLIAPGATVNDELGRRRLLTSSDLDLVLARAARSPEGWYRAVARRQLNGVDVGPFSYSGTRRDDPNDLFPHEHRRELRALGVFAAWLNHDAATAFGSRDVVVDVGGRRVVRHYLVDVGATLGSGSALASPAPAGDEYAWRSRSKLRSILTFGFSVRPWSKTAYPALPSVGLFEADRFAAETWKPPYGNPAFDNARPDDRFWAARRVVAFTDAAIRSAVALGQYSDSAAAAYLVETLLARRHKIARAWLNAVLPLADCRLSVAGVLECVNVAMAVNIGEPPGSYRVRWFRFDNETHRLDPLGDAQPPTSVPRFTAPAGLLDAGVLDAAMVAAEIRGVHPQFVGWGTPMTVYFRRTPEGWRTIGLDRLQ